MQKERNSGTLAFTSWRMERGWLRLFHDSIFRDKAVVVSGHFGYAMGKGRNETRDGGVRKRESIYTVPYKNAISADGILRELLASPYLFSPPFRLYSDAFNSLPPPSRQQLMAKLWSSQLLFNGTTVITASVVPGYQCSLHYSRVAFKYLAQREVGEKPTT